MVDTSTTYPSHDDILQLHFEVKALKNDLERNSREIHAIQLRDLQSVEDMRHYLQHRRQLGERARNLKAHIIKLYVDREGSPVKMEDWMKGLNIPLSPTRQSALYEDNGLAFSSNHYYDELNIGDINDTVKQNTDDLLEQLKYKIQQLENAVNSSNCSESLVDNPTTRSRPECLAQDVGGGVQNIKESETGFSQQHQCKQDAPGAVPSIKISSPTSLLHHSASTTKAARTRPKYPANVELKTIQTPPILSHKRSTITTFTTKHSIGRKEKLPGEKTVVKHKHVGDYMVHSRNAAAASMASYNSSSAAQTRGKISGFVWTVVIIASLSALFYMYPSLLNCILLLKDGAEQTLDEVTRVLDSIVVRAGGSPWLGSFTKSVISSTSSTSASSSESLPASQNVVEQAESIWEMILGYARTAYRYVLFDFP